MARMRTNSGLRDISIPRAGWDLSSRIRRRRTTIRMGLGAGQHIYSSALPSLLSLRSDSYLLFYRICVGRHVANNSMFIEMASLLWAFDFSAPTGPDGKPSLPDLDDTVDNEGPWCVSLIHSFSPVELI